MRDAIVIPINEKESLVISADNSGGIGMKEQDVVKVAYETVGYFSFRVAVMECVAAKARPLAVVIQNFCGDKEWEELVKGVQKGLVELGLEGVQITGSTESNFPLVQSAVGLNVVGLKSLEEKKVDFTELAVIGLPLVGNEVIECAEEIAPLSLFYQVSLLEDVLVWPVGSKGVQEEINRVMPGETFSCNIDLHKSGGPATSFLVGFRPEKENELKQLAGRYFHSLK